ncbi:MAG: 30S ribosomal protein S6 [Verrucomicrobia bacterium]|nr:30S ribosomal protein S6 [Verrucomicrobiota bacterium]MCH8525697.1 30S ribosomal protein S6 [Kiritimatiellia bacterium]
MNRYEAMVILPESLTEDEIEKGLGVLTAAVKKAGGTVAGKPTRLGRKAFARPMAKQTAGEYALMRFEMPGGNVDGFQKSLKLEEAIFRIQVTRLPEAVAS